MASEIQVQTISGPPTGANANKVIIPSGQTLELNEGIALPAGTTLPSGLGGKLIQSVNDTRVGTSATTSSSYIAQGLSVTITPTSTSSKIYLLLHCMYDTNNTQTVIYTYYRSIGGGAASNIFTAGNGNEGLGGAQSTNRGPIGAIAVDSPNTTSSVTYSLYYKNGSGGTIEFPPFGSMVQHLVAMEIGA